MTQFKQRAVFLVLLLSVTVAQAQTASGLSPEIAKEIDATVTEVLEETGVPSASVAIVHDGGTTWTRAYGLARLDPPTPATTSMRYPIGSISKQFTAAAVASAGSASG